MRVIEEQLQAASYKRQVRAIAVSAVAFTCRLQLETFSCFYPIVIKLALPPAAAVFTLNARSITRRSSAMLVSPCDKP